jgi:hypothetical protein
MNAEGTPRAGRTVVSATWAGLALFVQTLVIVIPGFVWAGAANEKITDLEKYRDQHRLESVMKSDFTELKEQTIRKDAFEQFSARVLESLHRIEERLEKH